MVAYSFVENWGSGCQFSILITVGCPTACRHSGLPLQWTCQQVTSCPVAAWPNPTYSLGAPEALLLGQRVHKGVPFSSTTPWIQLLLSCQTASAFRLQPVIIVNQLFLPHLDPFWKKACLYVEIPSPAPLQPQNDGGLLIHTVWLPENKVDAIS